MRTFSPIERWLATRTNPRGTQRQYRQALTDLADFAGDLLALTPELAAAWVRASEERLAPATVRSRMSAARVFYRWALRRKLVDEHPFEGVTGPKGSRGLRGRALTQDEALTLWKATRMRSTQPERDIALLEVALRCGLRRAEIAGLTWARVKLEAERPHLVIVGKGDRERLAKLNGLTAVALREWRACLNGAHEPGETVFGLTGSGVYKLVTRRAEEAGLEHLTPHDFRRTFVTWALNEGVPLEKVARAAGHARLETTMLYDRARRELEDGAPGDMLDWEL